MECNFSAKLNNSYFRTYVYMKVSSFCPEKYALEFCRIILDKHRIYNVRYCIDLFTYIYAYKTVGKAIKS